MQNEVIDKFMIYLYQQLRLEANVKPASKSKSIMKKENKQGETSNHKVAFVDEIKDLIKVEKPMFSSTDFIHYIDKFQAADNDIACIETDGEY